MHRIAAAMKTRAAGIGQIAVFQNRNRVIAFEILSRNVFKKRSPRVRVHSVADRTTGNSAVSDFHQMEKLAVFIVSVVEQIRRSSVTGGS